MRHIILLGSVSLLAACGGQDRSQYAPAEPEYAEEDSIVVTGSRIRDESVALDAANMAAPAPKMSGGGEEADAAIPRQLAYEYDATLRLPSGAVARMVAQHEARCNAAGPKVCQVISSSVSEQNADYIYGSLQIRAARSYMDDFRDGLSGEAEEADGQLTSMNARAEDLTRQITDTAARLDAQKTLRDRLLLLLERETDDVGDLLQIERELARVQGEIESAESWLKSLRARVAMDRLTLNYQSIPRAVTPQTAQPLKDAFTSFFSDVAWSLSEVIRFIARLLPWLIVIAPGLWLLRAVWRGWRKKK
ncbi:MAG: DUF4349 domain-containing protein [Pseudomonadota bacterium]